MQCIARCKSNPFKQCSLKQCENKLCKKHLTDKTVITINEPLFNKNEVYNFLMDFVDKSDIKKKQLIKKNIKKAKYILQQYNYSFHHSLNNKDVISIFEGFLNYYFKFISNIKHIIKIQSLFRRNNILKLNKLKGPGLFKSCVNETDFYTFEKKKNIDFNYLFSFEDEKKSIYFFDIRSFKLLIDNKTSDKIINPYNRIQISEDIIIKYNSLIKYLQNKNISIEFEPEILSDEQLFNQKVIKIFQKIDAFGYNTSIEWFTKLSTLKLRKMWLHLEDIWNYRCNLSQSQKNNIIQSTMPQPFSKFKLINSNYFYTHDKMIDKKKLQNEILDDVNIFLTSGKDYESSNIGCLYVLTSISLVSKDCIDAMPWLNQF
tara:strand:+ start:95 stop:1213 length:1119 start_codon:yes stop_codon:yes gene_type:complete